MLKKFLPNILILLGVSLIILSIFPTVYAEMVYRFMQFKNQGFILGPTSSSQEVVKDSAFARLLSTRPILIKPVDTQFGIVIEKIGVNAPVVADVNVIDENSYIESLKSGIAHASVSNYPSREAGNVYLFAHSSFNFWELGKYSSVFNLLHKMEVKDRVHVFFKQQDYVYEVLNKEIYRGWDTYPLLRPVVEPIITLQTCDPPGTTLNRLVVTAKLIDVKPL